MHSRVLPARQQWHCSPVPSFPCFRHRMSTNSSQTLLCLLRPTVGNDDRHVERSQYCDNFRPVSLISSYVARQCELKLRFDIRFSSVWRKVINARILSKSHAVLYNNANWIVKNLKFSRSRFLERLRKFKNHETYFRVLLNVVHDVVYISLCCYIGILYLFGLTSDWLLNVMLVAKRFYALFNGVNRISYENNKATEFIVFGTLLWQLSHKYSRSWAN